jgi:beta-glucanase (GH16 family)
MAQEPAKAVIFHLIVLFGALAPTLAPAANFELAWTDDFNGPTGARPDPKKWVYDIGYGNRLWGNNEFQTYTKKPGNVRLDGAGHLVITARREHDGKYTSARIKTLGKFGQRYGRFEARIQIPRGPGLLPAFWGMGEKGSWPDNGEIDIMENVGESPRTVFSNIHGPGYDGSGQHTLSTDLSKAFHVYGIEWTPHGIEWFLDGAAFKKVTPKDLPPGKRWVFDDQALYLLLDVAVGGDWPGRPVDEVLPQQMRVDWVKVWRYETNAAPAQ